MKFKSKYYYKHRLGQERIVKKFLLLPRHFKEDDYRKWLEFAYIKERISEIYFYDEFDYSISYGWVEIEFVTKDEYLEYKGKNNEN